MGALLFMAFFSTRLPVNRSRVTAEESSSRKTIENMKSLF
jgi:hypothetical protein